MGKLTITIPDGVDEAEALRAATNAVDAVAAGHAVIHALAQFKTSPGPGHLAQAALREARWRQVTETWGMLDGTEVATLTGNRPEAARDATANLRRRKGLTGVKRHGGLRYPGFQFIDGGDGTLVVAPAWTLLKDLLAPARWSDADVLAWAAAPNAWLEGRSPAEEIQEHPDDVTDALAKAADEAVPGPLVIRVT